jgi:hypothetical protein
LSILAGAPRLLKACGLCLSSKILRPLSTQILVDNMLTTLVSYPCGLVRFGPHKTLWAFPEAFVTARSSALCASRFLAGDRRQNHLLPNLFRINTYKSVTKQTTLTIFKINTYEKHMGERGTSNSSIISHMIYFVHGDERTVTASPLESALTKTGGVWLFFPNWNAENG